MLTSNKILSLFRCVFVQLIQATAPTSKGFNNKVALKNPLSPLTFVSNDFTFIAKLASFEVASQQLKSSEEFVGWRFQKICCFHTMGYKNFGIHQLI